MNFVNNAESLDPHRYRLWTPPAGRFLEVGPESRPVPLPRIPLPIHLEDHSAGEPSQNAIGQALYDYLRQFPDCLLNVEYAELLRDAFPHFLADLGAHAAMLDHKEVGAAYVQRKITCLKILSLLEPENARLLRQIGIAFYEMATSFSELPECRKHLLAAMGYLQRALRIRSDDRGSLNYLGQIDYLFGDYPSAARHWSQLVRLLQDGEARESLVARLGRIEKMDVPDHPLADDLEAVGAALEACGERDFRSASLILEGLEEEGVLLREMPMPEFYYLLGLCRAKTGENAGAFEAFERSLELDSTFQPALDGREAILDGRDL